MEWKILRLDEVDSTNEYAKKLIPDAPEGTVVVAKRQTTGRGRRGRAWASPEGGLWMSVVLKPPKIDPRLVFVGALAVADTLRDFGIDAWIKWPNDVWVGEKKISGILTEAKGSSVIMGIGLNVNNEIPNELKETAVSMKGLLDKSVNLEEVLKKLLHHLGHWYGVFLENPALLVGEVRERTVLIGKKVRVLQDGGELVGTVVDVSGDGSLLLDVDGQIIKVLYGDVSLRII
ncbi:biotin--[acetyl-CoA-carboxylase] ligase [Thermococcus stetteri]|uniref:biotin--[acetyl-CoA-carboxylase] ligase n=1 Tax=Thermococcus stetteri TaxID=49900 RepID=UPI001AE5B2C2|nr:biotin--[acetyl-CoA-carboxylase] ligase [Thermococcus stetteri]MBP1912288.1 BirA family biotin operon repressor/biotin-[acetyl-CoA-carboxylase] ligase [Thermococcus stetteri]